MDLQETIAQHVEVECIIWIITADQVVLMDTGRIPSIIGANYVTHRANYVRVLALRIVPLVGLEPIYSLISV